MPVFLLGLLTFLGLSFKPKPAQGATESYTSGVVDYGVQFGPAYVPQTNIPRFLTLDQMRQIVGYVNSITGNLFADDMILAVAKVESGHISDRTASFDRQAYRYEPTLGEASYGVLQILESTAHDRGLKGKPEQLYDPYLCVKIAILQFTWINNYLTSRIGRAPTIREILYAYNGGVGTFLRSRNGTPATRQYVDRYNTALQNIQA